jgi:hypothetical protein
MRSISKRSGQSLIAFLLAFPLLIGAMGLTVDLGWSYFRQQAAKSSAQAAALAATAAAGTLSLGNPTCGVSHVLCQGPTACPNSIPSPAITDFDVACQYAKDNGFANSSGGLQNVMVAAGTGAPTGLSGITVPYWVQVTTAENVAQTFSAVFGSSVGTVSVRSTSGYLKPSGGCIYVLGSPGTTFTMNGTPTLQTGCGIYVNSTSSAAASLTGTASITATGGATVNITGGWTHSGGSSVLPSPVLGTPAVSDPLSYLTPPTSSGCSMSGVSLSGTNSQTVSPCTAGGTIRITGGMALGGQSSITLNPGVYIIDNGISMSGGTTLNASGGVMLFIESGIVAVRGGAIVNLTAPASGPYKGVGLYQPSTNTSPVALSGGVTQIINGAVYLPGADLSFSGGSSLSTGGSTIVCKTVAFTGNSFIKQPASTAFAGSTGPTLIE